MAPENKSSTQWCPIKGQKQQCCQEHGPPPCRR